MADVNEKVETVQALISNLFNRHVPIKTVSVRNKKCPWFTAEVHDAIKIRRRLYAKWKRRPSIQKWEAYSRARNYSVFITRRAKNRYFLSKLSADRSSKELWSNLRSFGLGKNIVLNKIPDIDELNNSFLFRPASNSCFIPDSNLLFSSSRCLEFDVVSEADVILHIKELNSNAVGVDGLHLRFLKMILPHIASCITHLFNFCIMSSTFPDCWKQAKVIPVPKKIILHRPLTIVL